MRYPKAISTVSDLANGQFQEIIDDDRVSPKNVDTVAYCSGKIYFDILEKIEEIGGADNIAVIRLEQLYPLPEDQLNNIVNKYSKAKKSHLGSRRTSQHGCVELYFKKMENSEP